MVGKKTANHRGCRLANNPAFSCRVRKVVKYFTEFLKVLLEFFLCQSSTFPGHFQLFVVKTQIRKIWKMIYLTKTYVFQAHMSNVRCSEIYYSNIGGIFMKTPSIPKVGATDITKSDL